MLKGVPRRRSNSALLAASANGRRYPRLTQDFALPAADPGTDAMAPLFKESGGSRRGSNAVHPLFGCLHGPDEDRGAQAGVGQMEV